MSEPRYCKTEDCEAILFQDESRRSGVCSSCRREQNVTETAAELARVTAELAAMQSRHDASLERSADYGVANDEPRDELSRVTAQREALREALDTVVADCLCLSDEYLAVFDNRKDDDVLQGFAAGQWRRSRRAINNARAALAQTEEADDA